MSTGGYDTAKFYDSSAQDIFTAEANGAEVDATMEVSSNGTTYTVDSFEAVNAYSTRGGGDIAHLLDSAYADLLTAGLTSAQANRWAKVQLNASTLSPDNSAPEDNFFYIYGFDDADATYHHTEDDISGVDGITADWLDLNDLD